MKKFIITLLAAVFSMAGYAEVIDVGGLIPSTNETIYLKVGEVKAISVSFNNPHANTYELEWSSNLSGFCTVAGNGRSAIITGVALSGQNNVQITCKDKVIGAQCVFVVNVGDPPALTITQNPEDMTIIKGETATLSVEAQGGEEPYTYQWYEDGGTAGWIIISGATSSTYAAKPSATKAYNVTVTDADGTTKWASYCTVTVIDAGTPLTITTQPQNVTIKKGETYTFSVDVSGGVPPYSYRWWCYDNGSWVTISGATSSTYSSNSEKITVYYCDITDATGTRVFSDNVTVTTTTGIDNANTDENTVSDVKYFAPDGRAVTATAKGLVIRKTTYTDGTVKTDKVRK